MTTPSTAPARSGEDPVGNVLKWILLAVAVATFAVLGWTTKRPIARRHHRRTAWGAGRHDRDVGRRSGRRRGRLSARRPDGFRQPPCWTAWDFAVKSPPFFPRLAARLHPRLSAAAQTGGGS